MRVAFIVLLFSSLIMGCGSENPETKKGGNGSGGGGFNHNELATLLITELNATGEFDVELAKASTLRENYIIVKDLATGDFTAVNISGFAPGVDAAEFLNNNATSSFFNLSEIAAHYEYYEVSSYDDFCECYETLYDRRWVPTRYQHAGTGFMFEKNNGSSKDLETFAALAEEVYIGNKATELASRFGLSVDRSKEVARIAMAWNKRGGRDFTEKDQDAFSNELLGFSITEAQKAMKSFAAGDTSSMLLLVDRAAATNGTTPEHMRQLLDLYIN